MPAATAEERQQERLRALEERVEAAIDGALEARVRRLERAVGLPPAAGLSTAAPRVEPALAARRRPAAAAGAAGAAAATADCTGRLATPDQLVAASREAETPTPSSPHGPTGASAPVSGRLELGDQIGGRLLAWAGGAATLLGIALFLALAISRGWIGEEARVSLAGGVSAALLALGVWLHGHRGRTEAAVAMTGAAVAGMFATLVVASAGYGLIPGLLALALSLLVGATATALAVRWEGRALAALGLVGSLAAPALVGAPAEWPTLAMLLLTSGLAMWLAARRRWAWLTAAAVVVTAPQWAVPMLERQTAGEDLLVLCAFALLGLAGPLAAMRRSDREDRSDRGEESGEQSAVAALGALVLSAAAAAIVGRAALAGVAGDSAGTAWLAALAVAHGALAAGPRRLRLGARPRALLAALAIVLGDIAFALSFHGVVLAAGWGASAVALSLATRRGSEERRRAAGLGDLGVGMQASLAIVRALAAAPPAGLISGEPRLAGAASLLVAMTACAACSGLAVERSRARAAFGGAALALLAYLTATTLQGPALAIAWAAEAGALLAAGARREEPLAAPGAVAFGAGALLYTLAVLAPPTALAGGADLGSAAPALAALCALAWRGGQFWQGGSRGRLLARLAGGGAILYLASLAAASLPDGQVALSALWALSGVGLLLCGLRLNSAPIRNAALGLLLGTIAKVFLYDLSTLTSVARVVSFLVLGALLLAGAYAYQRLRPPPQPDLRGVHPSQR